MSCFEQPRSSWGCKAKPAAEPSRPVYFFWLAWDWLRASAPLMRSPRSRPWRPDCCTVRDAMPMAAGRRATSKARHQTAATSPIPRPPPLRQHRVDKHAAARSAGAQILDRLVAAKKVEERAQRLPALAFELRVAFEHQARVVMGDRDQLLVDREIGEAQARQPALPRPQHLAGAAQPQILLGDAKPVLGFAQDLETPLGDGTERRLVEEQAARRLIAAADAAAQLVQLGEAETLGVLDDDDRGVGHVDADLDHGRRDQQTRLTIAEGRHRPVLVVRLHPPVDQPDAT